MLQGLTAHYLCFSTYPLERGDTCLVHAAAGGVGQAAGDVAVAGEIGVDLDAEQHESGQQLRRAVVLRSVTGAEVVTTVYSVGP